MQHGSLKPRKWKGIRTMQYASSAVVALYFQTFCIQTFSNNAILFAIWRHLHSYSWIEIPFTRFADISQTNMTSIVSSSVTEKQYTPGSCQTCQRGYQALLHSVTYTEISILANQTNTIYQSYRKRLCQWSYMQAWHTVLAGLIAKPRKYG